MSVLTPSKLGGKPSEKQTLGKGDTGDQNNQRRPRKSKKDYVYKFWAALSKCCEPIIKEYTAKLQRKQENSLKTTQSEMSDNKTATEKEDEKTNVGISFEELGAFMANKQLIVLVGKFWSLLRAYVKNEGIRKESMKDARIILSTLMISMFPTDLLDASDAKDMDPLSRACYTAAQRVLMQVFVLKEEAKNSGKLNVSKTKFHCQEAHKAIVDFLGAFKDWQTQDKTKLIKIGLNQYEQWQRSYHVIKLTNMNEGQKEGVLKVIETNIKNMKERILKVLDGNKEKMNQLCAQIDEKLKNEQAQAAHHPPPPQSQAQVQAKPQASGKLNQAAITTTTTSVAAVSGVDSKAIPIKRNSGISGVGGDTGSVSLTMSSAQNNGDTNGNNENNGNNDNGGHQRSPSRVNRPQGRQKDQNLEKTPPRSRNHQAQSPAQTQQQTIEEKLRARGVPVNMKTGNSFSNSPASASASSNFGYNNNNYYYSDSEEKKSDKENDDDAGNGNGGGSRKYITEINGSKFLNLDAIIMEEASRKYWLDFEKEIENENWSRLFELLSEILSRVKKLSPKRDAKMLDDMIDVKFISQTISNGLIDASGFYGIYFGIWKQLKSLHAPARDDAWDKWHDKTLEDMSKPDATWAKLLSSVFNTFLIKIDEIEDQTKAIYQSVKNKR